MTDMDLLWDPLAKQHPAYEAFTREMKDRRYGEEPLNKAWAWFKAGWEKAWNHFASTLEKKA